MKTCPHCEGPLVRKRFGPLPKYCSTACRVAASHARAKADGREAAWRRARAERLAAERAARPQTPCPYCGDPMANPRRVQCGKAKCRQRWQAQRMRTYMHERRVRLRGGRVESFTAEEIFERDGWRCGICQQRVGRTLEHPHPRSASLDHIIPIAAGGDHVRENVQCAHLGCNSRKCHLGPGQLLLVG